MDQALTSSSFPSLHRDAPAGDVPGEAGEEPHSRRGSVRLPVSSSLSASLSAPSARLDQLHIEPRVFPPRTAQGAPGHRAAPGSPAPMEAEWLAEPAGFAAGVLVALLTLVVPVASVMLDRAPRPDGSQPPPRVALPR